MNQLGVQREMFWPPDWKKTCPVLRESRLYFWERKGCSANHEAASISVSKVQSALRRWTWRFACSVSLCDRNFEPNRILRSIIRWTSSVDCADRTTAIRFGKLPAQAFLTLRGQCARHYSGVWPPQTRITPKFGTTVFFVTKAIFSRTFLSHLSSRLIACCIFISEKSIFL